MSNVTSGSLAAGTFTGIRNEVINPTVSILERKIVIVGVADATKLSGTLDANTPRRVFSAEEVGEIAGQGTMIHRLAIATYKGSNGLETWIIPQDEGGSDVAATGSIAVTATSAKSGVLALYVNGEILPISVATGDTATLIGDKIVAALASAPEMPVTGVNTTGTVAITAKSKGVFGNDISLAVGLQGEVAVEGVTVAITDMASGSGTADIQAALDAMGQGDNRNENYFTAMVHGYGKDQTTLTKISEYVGEGNDAVGCYDKINGRFFRSLVGSVANDLNAEIAFADQRINDRANGLIVVPNSPNHPNEIAALAIGMSEFENSQLAQGSYFNKVMPGILLGATRWSDEYNNRDIAVKNGISPTMAQSGAVVLQNVISFYRPTTVPVANNGYRSMRNISISQNVVYAVRKYFEQENWQNITIVKDVAKVTNPAGRKRAKDIRAVKDALLFLAGEFEALGWIFSLDATVDGLKDPLSVTLRDGGTGFDYTLKLVYSGEGGILNNDVIFDINFSG